MVKIFSFYTGQVFGGLPYRRSLTPRVSPSHAPVLSFAHCTTSKRLLRRLIFPSPGNFHHNHSSIIVLQYWRTQNVCNISKTNFFLINQKMKFLVHAASCLLLVMHWNNIETGLELKQMDCLIKRGFQVFLLQLLSPSFRYIQTISSLLYVDQPIQRFLFSPGNCDITPIVRIVRSTSYGRCSLCG